MKISLSNQVILVTGGSRGIGAAIVETLAGAGATVALHYGQSAAAAQALAATCGPQVHLFAADLTDPAQVARLLPAVEAACGPLTGLVHNAGIALPTGLDQDQAAWQRAWEQTLQVNLVAAAAITRTCLPGFIARGGGRIVHIASRAAFRGDTPDYMAYAASKAGMVALSRSLARGYGRQGIKSFVVAPGFTETDMARQFIEDYGPEIVQRDLALPSLTQPADIAPSVLFLLSGHLDHATGCTLDINAGSYVH